MDPDAFTDVIVPLYGFDACTGAIVASWQERTLDKGELCLLATLRMGLGCEPGEALLIDNREDCISQWTARGGAGYHFTSDAAFERDVVAGIDALVR